MDRESLTKELLSAFQEFSTQAIMLHGAAADVLGLNVTDHKCLRLLQKFGPMSAGRLAELTGLTTGAITGIVDRLEAAKYAKRRDDPSDRRAIIVEAINSAKLEKKLAMIYEPISGGSKSLISEYKSDELRIILEFLKKLIEGSRNETIRIRKLNRKNIP